MSAFGGAPAFSFSQDGRQGDARQKGERQVGARQGEAPKRRELPSGESLPNERRLNQRQKAKQPGAAKLKRQRLGETQPNPLRPDKQQGAEQQPDTPTQPKPRREARAYAELCVTSNFTFLTGASHPEELVTRAAELGLAAIAITDRNSLAGVVRAYRALQILAEQGEESVRIRSQHRVDNCSRQEIGTPEDIPRPEAAHLPKLIVGARLVLIDGAAEWVALPTDKRAYQRLTRLLSLGKQRARKGECHLHLADLLAGCEGMILIALPGDISRAPAEIAQIRRRYPGNVFTGAVPRYDGQDAAWLKFCSGRGRPAGMSVVRGSRFILPAQRTIGPACAT